MARLSPSSSGNFGSLWPLTNALFTYQRGPTLGVRPAEAWSCCCTHQRRRSIFISLFMSLHRLHAGQLTWIYDICITSCWSDLLPVVPCFYLMYPNRPIRWAPSTPPFIFQMCSFGWIWKWMLSNTIIYRAPRSPVVKTPTWEPWCPLNLYFLSTISHQNKKQKVKIFF